jgi:hypothetical protein
MTLMFLSEEQIAHCIRWLIDHASPPVRYLTHRHILKTALQSKPMVDLWKDVETGRDAHEIFDTQNEDGSWFSGGPWGPKGYRQETWIHRDAAQVCHHRLASTVFGGDGLCRCG